MVDEISDSLTQSVWPDSSARQKTRGANSIKARVQQKSHERADFVALRIKLLRSSCSRLEHRQNRRTLKIVRGDSFEMRADAAQFGSQKRIDKTQAAVEQGKQLVLDLVVNCKRNLRASWPNLSEVNDSHQVDIPAHGLKRIPIGRIALDRQKDGVSLKTERTAKAEISRLR